MTAGEDCVFSGIRIRRLWPIVHLAVLSEFADLNPFWEHLPSSKYIDIYRWDVRRIEVGVIVDSDHQKSKTCSRVKKLRNCGKLFCGACTNFTYHRVQDSKGEQVRVCFECYSSMSRASGTPAIVGTSTPLQSSTSQNRTPTHQSPPPAFFIGSANGQTVFG